MLNELETIIERDIRPLVRRHEGDVELLGFDEGTGTVSVRLSGTCVGCPLSRITLKVGILRTLQKEFPQIRDVVAEQEQVREKGNV